MEISRHWRLQKTSYGTARGGLAGEIYSFTTVYDPPAGFESQAPYTVALVRLIEEAGGQRIEGPLVTAMLTDLDVSLPPEQRIFVGQPVEMVTRKLSEDGPRGQINYGYKFRPPVS